MNLKRGLVSVLLLSSVVFAGGVALEHRAEPDSETVLGIDLESPNLVATAIVLSVLFAVAVSLRPGSLVLGITGVFGLIFAILDIMEILHQFQEHRPSIAAIAGVATLFHLAITTLAIVLMRRARVRQRLAS